MQSVYAPGVTPRGIALPALQGGPPYHGAGIAWRLELPAPADRVVQRPCRGPQQEKLDALNHNDTWI